MAVAVGSALALAGVGVVAMAIWRVTGLNAPRWVVGSVGGSFIVLGAWTAVCYALGWDPRHPDRGLPRPWVQVSICLPGVILFSVPFHWVAFGGDPRTFSGGLSVPFLTVGNSINSVAGRVMFGLGAIMIDALAILWTVQTLRRRRLPKTAGRVGDRRMDYDAGQ
jgi:hypothetical protein